MAIYINYFIINFNKCRRMKQVKFKFPVRLLALMCGLFLTVNAFAQQIAVKGLVKDATGEPVIGATVRIADGSGGAVTDFDGNFTLNVKAGTKLQISYIGYDTQEVVAKDGMIVVLKEDAGQSLNEVVVIGYGAVKKSDLTGSVTALKPDAKNKGVVVNAQDMMQGKIAGVNVTNGGGTPGGGATIRIRGGSSLSASNDPLIVIDGVPMDNDGVKGLSNPLSMVNPQDIENFNVLKDASATAIYGSRGSNGVIIITTKKGHKGQKPTVSYAGSATVSMKQKTYDVMSGDEYRAYIKDMYGENSTQYGLLGDANTDWQDEILRTAISHDHNVTVSGSTSLGEVGYLPYRVSAGYTSQEGILKGSDFERVTGAINLSPSFFNDHLTMNLNAKGMWAKSNFVDTGAIGAALYYDPTQPVTSTDPRFSNFGGYYQWLTASGFDDSTWDWAYNAQATKNPVSMLELRDDQAISRSFVGNADIDYKVHGFEDLRLHVTLGADVSKGKQSTDVLPSSPLAQYYGSYGNETILKRTLTLNSWAQYYHDFNDPAKNHVDLMLGYEWQHRWRERNNDYMGFYPSTNNDPTLAGTARPHTPYLFRTESYIVSFLGRLNYSLMDRYLFTATVRRDGTSRFKDHWDTFPALAFAWKMNEENNLRDLTWLSDLKLRLGYGQTGQQEGGVGDYSYFPVYRKSTGTNGFYPILGDGFLYSPIEYNENLKWEKTTTYNIGLDWGFCNQRFTGSVDWYYRKTTDLLNMAKVPAGSNFRNEVISNIGSLSNMGVEVAMDWKVIRTNDWFWSLNYNFTYNHNKITDLTGGADPSYFVPTGGISSGISNNVQAHAVGHPASSFYVYQQVYDENGKPIEGLVVDRDGNGVITENDKYFYKSPAAPVTMGLSSRLEYKNWDFGFTLRASLGNYVFNDFEAGASNCNPAEISKEIGGGWYQTNRPLMVLDKNWQTYDWVLSDYFVHNASFLKCDNITLGYTFQNLFKGGNYQGISGRIYATASNVFTITNYDGIDPEVYGGIDNNVYPRPISFILGLNLNF